MANVRLLDAALINQIAAGEVIERPASVLKELLENAIDAGASQIDVDIRGSGRVLIRIVDNGCGMSKEDLHLSIRRHATSKIMSVKDLEHIQTLGFRGEALYSIAGVSKLKIRSSIATDSTGHEIRIEAGVIQEDREVALSQGTVVEVEGLFYNTPVRLKFLKSPQTEMSHLHAVLQNYALAHPQITFTLGDGKKNLLYFPKAKNLQTRVGEFLGLQFPEQLVQLEGQGTDFKVTGFVALPEFSRPNRTKQFFYVNKRPVKIAALSYTLSKAFFSLLPHDRFPIAVIFIEMDPRDMDVNVHPTKREVRFRQTQRVQDAVFQALRQSLSTAYPDSVHRDQPKHMQPQRRVESALSEYFSRDPQKPFIPKPMGLEENRIQPVQSVQSVQVKEHKICFELMGVIEDLFWIIRLEDGIALVDQHAAHERVLYERFSEGWQTRQIETQRLLSPHVLELDFEENAFLNQNRKLFQSLGFGLEEFGPQSLALTEIPSYIKGAELDQLFKDILSELREGTQIEVAQKSLEEKLMSRACRSAVKGRDALSPIEMEKLLNELLDCKLPYTCPHGRPTLIRYTVKDLYKLFKRT